MNSLLAQSLPADRYEIVVVDDGSTDQTPAVLRGFDGRVRVVRFAENQGRSAARNTGIREAQADLIVFVDSDVVVRPDFLEWHLRTHREHGPGILSRGPVVPAPDPVGAQTARPPRVASSPAYLDTANAAVGRDLLIRAGMFDEAFPGYGWEDFDLGIRLKALGVKRVFCRQAAAFHIQPPMQPQALDALFAKEEERARSAVYFYRKHPTLETRLLIQATVGHRVLYWMLAGGGALNRGNLPRVVARLQAAGLHALALLASRSVLNRYYLQVLAQEWSSRAPGLA